MYNTNNMNNNSNNNNNHSDSKLAPSGEDPATNIIVSCVVALLAYC